MKTRSFLTFLLACCLLVPTAEAKKRVKIPTEKEMAAYLLVYFKDDTHSLHMALSVTATRLPMSTTGSPSLRAIPSPSNTAYATRTSCADPTEPSTWP